MIYKITIHNGDWDSNLDDGFWNDSNLEDGFWED